MSGLGRTLSALASLAAAAVGAFGLPPAAVDAPLVAGSRGFLVTVLEGNEPREIPVVYLGTYRDFAGPGYDLHLVQLEGPDAERVGVAAGMSGSPVYFGGKLVGALSYRMGLLPRDPVAGVTPIEDMVEAARRESPSSAHRTQESGIAPIATPVVAAGLAPGVRDWFGPRLAERGFVLAAGGGRSQGAGAAPPVLEPGSPVGVELLRGDLRIAATGTVTWVDRGRVYAFGHPFLGRGRVEMPMVSAEVIHTLADLAGSVRLANIGEELGAVVEDRHSAIIGQVGGKARMIQLGLALHGGDYGDQRFQFELVDDTDLAPLLSATAMLQGLQSAAGYSPATTLVAKGIVHMTHLGELPLEMAFAGTAGADPTVAAATQVYAVLTTLWRNPFVEPAVERIELRVDVRPEIVNYRLDDLHYSREALRPGATLRVQCVLQKYQGESATEELSLTLPQRLPSEGVVLAVGNPLEIDQAVGGTLPRRLQTAADAASYVRVLADLRSANRLSAVIYEPGGAVVARGSSFTQLPPTAEWLLATQAPATRRTSSVSPLARAERELEGPVTGLQQVRLQVERGTTARPVVGPSSR